MKGVRVSTSVATCLGVKFVRRSHECLRTTSVVTEPRFVAVCRVPKHPRFPGVSALFVFGSTGAVMLTERDLAILQSVVRYYTLTRTQVTRLHFPNDPTGRMTRKRLHALVDLGLLAQTNMKVVNPAMGQPAPVYFPTRDGVAFLVEHTGDDHWRTAGVHSPNWQHLYHFTEIADQHILIDRAVDAVPGLSISSWLGEYSVADPKETEPHKRFALYTLLSQAGQHRVVCKPDAGFLLSYLEHSRVYYLETDRDTTKNAERVAAQKTPGYAALRDQRGYVRHFPAATVESFTVLMIAPTARRRDSLRKMFAAKSASSPFKFAAKPELTPENLFAQPVWLNPDGQPTALLKRSAT